MRKGSVPVLLGPKAGAFGYLEEGVGFEESAEGLGFFVGEVDEGESDFIGAVALEGDGGFDGDGVGVESHESGEERVVAFLKFESFGEFAFEASLDEADHDLWDEVGGDADEANGSAGHEGEGEGVIAGEDLEVFGDGLDELVDTIDGAACFFVGDDVGAVVGEAGDGFDADFDDRATGDGVEHDREAGVGGDRFVVLVESFLRGFVVVRADLERCVGAGFFGGLGEVDGFVGGVGSAAGYDENALVGEFDGGADDFEVFVGVKSGRFSGGADGDDASDAGCDLSVDEGFEGFVIE